MGVELKLPQELKACLVEYWDLVNKQKQLFQLPAEKNVEHILENYVTFLKSQRNSDNSVDELVYGIRKYFNKMLGTQLLCQFENPQYAEILLAYPDIPMSQIYGAPHLLRIFVNIGTALAHWSLNSHSLISLSSYMHVFLNYLSENTTSLFGASNYKLSSIAYSIFYRFKALCGSADHSVMT
ncbi:mortality factor 4-like protein 2 [Cricetulus griseus]|nr:mortality factor 4-like protein 2 [Cricetulus griseus]XP_027289743.1 mortality factor 4-like protein 2 [Cricetulus griseus]